MDLNPDLLLHFLADWLYHFILECPVNLFFIVVYCYIWGLEVLDVPKHFQRIVESHKEVIELVGSL